MKTYQDYLKIQDSDEARMQFVRDVIEDYKNTDTYKTALLAEEYDKKQNRTILNFKKLLYTLSGKAVPDEYSSDYRIVSSFFPRFVSEQNQTLLANGVKWKDGDKVNAIIGSDFDNVLMTVSRYAIVGGVGYGFFNVDHVEAYKATEFAPLKDERTSAIKAGVRFWQIDATKPLHAMFFELDGVTEYVYDDKGGSIYAPKRSYIIHTENTKIDGEQKVNEENYSTFPVVPLYANAYHQSELIGIQSGIDCYDLIKSGFANTLQDAQELYWVLENAGGMDEQDTALFLQRVKTTRVVQVDGDGASAHHETIDVPYAAREAVLDRIERDLYKDFMSFNHETIANGAVNIPQIKASYELLNSKLNDYEYYVLDFVNGILELAGIFDEDPSFTRSMLTNDSETINILLSGANYLEPDYITMKILEVLGDGDKAEDMIASINADNLNRLASGGYQQAITPQVAIGGEPIPTGGEVNG